MGLVVADPTGACLPLHEPTLSPSLSRPTGEGAPGRVRWASPRGLPIRPAPDYTESQEGRGLRSPSATCKKPIAIPVFAARDVEVAVGLLSAVPGVRRIWLFGSVAKARKPDFRSDLDLAVEGLAADRQLSVWASLDEALELPPDLVRLEEASPTLRDEIQRWGILLYERT